MTTRALVTLQALVIGGLAWFLKKTRKRHLSLPPGPPTEPIIGHARLVPSEKQEDLFIEWAKVYGDILYLKFPGQRVVVLNSIEAANDLLERRSAIYSGRPKFTAFELMGWAGSLFTSDYGDLFRKQRRILQDYLNTRRVVNYQHAESTEANILLKNLVHDPQNLTKWLERFSASIILNIVYGHQVKSDDDEYLKITAGVNYAMGNCGAPGNTPVDVIPILRFFPSWFPGTYYVDHARKHRKYIDALHEVPFKRVQTEMAAGAARPSLVAHHLEKSEGRQSDFNIQHAAGVAYAAGGETTSSTLTYLFFTMLLFPDCQRRAQQEIDTVVGSGRLPDFRDRASLPYVEGIYQEILRWCPVSPLGIPHRSNEDDVYNGMFIPKGSLMIANIKAMTRDERRYADPTRFNPSRYLPRPEGNNEPRPDFIFGFGRRICPGRHLASGSIWVALVRILATLELSKPLDADGSEVTPSFEFTSGLTSHPVPFRCQIKPRSKAALNLIREAPTWEDD